jgi:hypothetical protein
MAALTNYKQFSIDEFTRITNYDISVLFVKVEDFFVNKSPNIINFYRGLVNKPDAQSFSTLKTLLVEAQKVIELFRTNKERFDKFYFWELLDNFTDLQTKLQTIDNISKYLRSSRTKNAYLSTPEKDYTLSQHETLENVQVSQISNIDFDNDWQTIAMRNDLREEDYTDAGGKTIKLPMPFNSSALTSIIDNPIGEAVYGKDINKKLTFVNDDIEVLGYQETLLQTLEILTSIKKGDIPEFPFLGLDESLVVGGNLASFRLPSIIRQLNEVFATDDSLTDFRINKLTNDQDSMNLTYQVNTILGAQQQGQTNI